MSTNNDNVLKPSAFDLFYKNCSKNKSKEDCMKEFEQDKDTKDFYNECLEYCFFDEETNDWDCPTE